MSDRLEELGYGYYEPKTSFEIEYEIGKDGMSSQIEKFITGETIQAFLINDKLKYNASYRVGNNVYMTELMLDSSDFIEVERPVFEEPFFPEEPIIEEENNPSFLEQNLPFVTIVKDKLNKLDRNHKILLLIILGLLAFGIFNRIKK